MGKKVVHIKMITAENCLKCESVMSRIIEAAKKAGVLLAIQKFDSSTNDAVKLGVDYGLDDVPSFIVGDKPFCGTGFSDSDLEKEMKGNHG